MSRQTLIADIGLGLIGGYVGTKLMGPVSTKLFNMESEAAKKQENAVSPGSPYELAARKTADMLGLHLSDDTIKKVGTPIFHYGLGAGWGPLYTLLRRENINPMWATLATGAAPFLLVDETLTPRLGLSAPDLAYPAATHIRGALSHFAFGLGVAATVEVLTWLGRRA